MIKPLCYLVCSSIILLNTTNHSTCYLKFYQFHHSASCSHSALPSPPFPLSFSFRISFSPSPRSRSPNKVDGAAAATPLLSPHGVALNTIALLAEKSRNLCRNRRRFLACSRRKTSGVPRRPGRQKRTFLSQRAVILSSPTSATSSG